VRTSATYRITAHSAELTAAAVTTALGVAPSRTVEAGERMTPRASIARQSYWSLSSGDIPEPGAELADSLTRVLNQLHPLRAKLWTLAETGYEMDWFCYLGSHATEHAAEIPREVMHQLLDVPGTLLLDIYDEDDDN
jgi:Domain of unknown function (DUF4279)